MSVIRMTGTVLLIGKDSGVSQMVRNIDYDISEIFKTLEDTFVYMVEVVYDGGDSECLLEVNAIMDDYDNGDIDNYSYEVIIKDVM